MPCMFALSAYQDTDTWPAIASFLRIMKHPCWKLSHNKPANLHKRLPIPCHAEHESLESPPRAAGIDPEAARGFDT